jgi:general secretion pathway protein D
MVQTIKKMDVYPREVLIEAIIAEVTHTNQDELGLQWSVLHRISESGEDWTGVVENSFGNAPSLFTNTPGLAEGPTGFSYVLFRPEKVTALFKALASESKINILSSPSLLVRDQEEAIIEVGSEIPTATRTTTSTTLETLTQEIEYRTVGIKLKIKPTISEERTVVLDVEQEVSDKGEDQQVGPEGNMYPTFNTTKTKTSIVVPDRMGILIGGIMKEKKEKGYQGIPLLSKIPLLGALFRYQTSYVSKKELIILITPRVVANKTEAEFIVSEYMEKLRELKKYLKEKAEEMKLKGINNQINSSES